MEVRRITATLEIRSKTSFGRIQFLILLKLNSLDKEGARNEALNLP